MFPGIFWKGQLHEIHHYWIMMVLDLTRRRMKKPKTGIGRGPARSEYWVIYLTGQLYVALPVCLNDEKVRTASRICIYLLLQTWVYILVADSHKTPMRVHACRYVAESTIDKLIKNFDGWLRPRTELMIRSKMFVEKWKKNCFYLITRRAFD